ncbi:ABC transporter ATP-binding protein [Hondaea fermentalgiana]|uniref:ABC transporter ATP-binding protein n=1 Tax=Hondaea fermentalgiana TaxID=2315210 RepID=A0A2R5GAZ1_9STRA|nr:ABC transporter ATP-binding protein [Hondaea fermentalgiana]|eukprot:GBG28177.1 ABC transporter ATP-binding protein [Hondaea fermentalgiana]
MQELKAYAREFVRQVSSDALDEFELVMDIVRSRLDVEKARTRRFDAADELKSWILAHQNQTLAAVYFTNVEDWTSIETWDDHDVFTYVLQVNETKHCAAIGTWGCDNPYAEVAIPMQTAIDAALASHFGAEEADIRASFSDFPHPDMASNFDVVASFGPSFLYIAVSFNYVIQLTLIVEEKELHLVEAMKQMGMTYTAYWTSWFLVNTFVNTLMVLLLVAFGTIFGLELFAETATSLLLVFFWLSSMSFTSLAFLFSTLTRNTSNARLMGIAIFILTFIAAPVMVPLLMQTGDPADDTARMIMSLLPIFSFFHVLDKMIAESSGSSNLGLAWGDRMLNILPPNDDGESAIWTLQDSFGALVRGFLILTFVAWYLDHVIPNEYGKRDSFIFFLKPSFWIPIRPSPRRAQVTPQTQKADAATREVAAKDIEPDTDQDVADETIAVRSRDFGGREIAILFDHLRKTFRGGFFETDFHAVRGIDLGIDTNSCFVLLGHNGAGKTTTLRMLAGNADVTSGDISVFGRSVVHDMGEIRKFMGVCPQHDILWDKLTAREHLRLFAVIKGMSQDQIENEVALRLEQTSLTSAADSPSAAFSGGMKRRLSIAIALIGDPKLVTLDEPTTGMDVETRREVWDMINQAKKGRVIILTTHSMEEADILGDRIGVMSKGRMQALGTSLRLKSKYGRGYRLSLLLNSGASRAKVEDMCKQKTSCCMITVFPVFIMLLLLLLDAALLTPFKLEAIGRRSLVLVLST